MEPVTPSVIQYLVGVLRTSPSVMELIFSVRSWNPGSPRTSGGFTSINAGSCRTAISAIRQLRIRIAQLGEVRCARLNVELRQHRVITLLFFQFRYAAVGIVDIPEHDRVGRARLLAGG